MEIFLQFTEIILKGFLSSIFIISCGYILSKLFSNHDKEGLAETGLLGFVLIGMLAVILNFFTPLSKSINNLILIFPIIALILILKKNKVKEIRIKKFIFFNIKVTCISLILIAYSKINMPDGAWYHLPYTKILNDHKIIFGITTLQSVFGVTSIFQYISAFFNNSFFNDRGIILPTALCLSFFIIFFISKFKNNKNFLLKIFSFFICSYIFLQINRYGKIGNDYLGYLYLMYLIYTFFSYKRFYNYDNFFKKLLLTSFFCLTNKLLLVFTLLIPAYILIKKIKSIVFFNVKSFVILIFVFSWILKNIIISGCLFYPIKITCNENLAWYSNKENFYIAANNFATFSELHNKQWNSINSYKSYNENKEYQQYVENFNWFNNWIQKKGYLSIFKILDTFVLYLIILFFVFFITHEKNYLNLKIRKIFFTFKIQFLFYFSLISFIMLFYKLPVGRYLFGYLILIIFCLISPLFYKFKKKSDQILKLFLILSFVTFVSKNVFRITSEITLENNNIVWPKIYNFTNKLSDEPINFSSIKKNSFNIYFSNSSNYWFAQKKLCGYNTSPCAPNNHSFDQFVINKKLSYKIFNLNKN